MADFGLSVSRKEFTQNEKSLIKGQEVVIQNPSKANQQKNVTPGQQKQILTQQNNNQRKQNQNLTQGKEQQNGKQIKPTRETA
jgi:hypothetical protein